MTHYIRLNNKEEMQKLLDEGLLLTNHGFMVEDEHPFNNFPAIFEITNKDEEIKSEFIPIKTELETHYDLKYHIMVKESPKEYIYNDYVSWYKESIGVDSYIRIITNRELRYIHQKVATYKEILNDDEREIMKNKTLKELYLKRNEINALIKQLEEKVTDKIPSYGDLIPIDEFREDIERGVINSDDGNGCYATLTECSPNI